MEDRGEGGRDADVRGGGIGVKGRVQVAVMSFNLRQWHQFYPKAAESSLLTQLIQEGDSLSRFRRQESRFREALLAAEPGERRSLLESHLREQIAQVLKLAPSRIDSGTPLSSLGFDSLMVLELRNRLEASLGITLSATLVWNYPTIAALVPHLASKMEISLDPISGSRVDSQKDDGERAEVLANLKQLSEDEAEALLLEKLAKIDERKLR
jgi:myxalamid-type polyketide synthase MxaE and MxaD